MFPGLYCPGLIEERRRGEGGASGGGVFPGLYCPGLIEERSAPSSAWPAWPCVFPGLYCPGLIEDGRSLHNHLSSSGVFPGLYCPGLIEDRSPHNGPCPSP